MSTSTEQSRPQDENRFHNYQTNRIPWYVHLIWILFWCGAAYYTMTYLIPAMRTEVVTPP